MLEAPEVGYGSKPGRGSGGARRGADSLDRRMRRDLSEDFADPAYEDDAPMGRRRGGGVRLRFDGMPRGRWGWIAAGVLLVVVAGAAAGVYAVARSFLLHDERFVIAASSAIELDGNTHVTRAQMLTVFGEDVERNIFRVPLAERRAQLEQIPWVAHATVMRLLPNRLRVSIVERTPVAFVRQGSRIGLVDASGVLLDMPSAGKGSAQYSFPVVSGISAGDPLSTRTARMKIFGRFTSELDSSGEKISQGLSEVDLSNPEDVKALIPDHSTEIMVHFGEDDFLDRYRRFEQHLPEWRTVYPKLSSVDMRYERQVVLEMEPGSGIPMTTSTNAGGASPAADASTAAGSDAIAKKNPAEEKIARPDHAAVAKIPVHAKARSGARSGAGSAQGKRAAAKAKPHAAASTKPHAAGVKHQTVVAGHSSGASRYHPTQVVHP